MKTKIAINRPRNCIKFTMNLINEKGSGAIKIAIIMTIEFSETRFNQ
jgi:hypothetical protein